MPLRIALVFLVAVIAGCSSAFQATGDTLFYAFDPDRRVRTAPLNPQFEYLRVIVDGRLALLARGVVDQREGRDLEVFFSADGEVLKLSAGRIEEFSNGKRHLVSRPSSGNYPAWDPQAIIEYQVEVDARPTYQFSVPQQRLLKALVSPPKKTNLKGIDPRALIWFEESSADSQASPQRSVFGIRLDPSGPQIVYSEQCIASDLCFSLQRWRASGSY
jgi:hypothetical protein